MYPKPKRRAVSSLHRHSWRFLTLAFVHRASRCVKQVLTSDSHILGIHLCGFVVLFGLYCLSHLFRVEHDCDTTIVPFICCWRSTKKAALPSPLSPGYFSRYGLFSCIISFASYICHSFCMVMFSWHFFLLHFSFSFISFIFSFPRVSLVSGGSVTMIAEWAPVFPNHNKGVTNRVAMFTVAFGTHAGCCIDACLWVALFSVCFKYQFVCFTFYFGYSKFAIPGGLLFFPACMPVLPLARIFPTELWCFLPCTFFLFRFSSFRFRSVFSISM